MLIRFANSRRGYVLTCLRDDGTMTYARPKHGPFFAQHDLRHYAVETTLKFRDAFYGLIEQGRSIPSFDQPGSARTLPPQAIHAEFVVGLLDSDTGCPAAEFNA